MRSIQPCPTSRNASIISFRFGLISVDSSGMGSPGFQI
jgi:hypothetical protein